MVQGSRPVVLQLRGSYPRACIGTSTLIIGAADLSSRRFDAAVPKLPLQRARGRRPQIRALRRPARAMLSRATVEGSGTSVTKERIASDMIGFAAEVG